MRHDELLARLEGLWHDSFKAPGYQALRAVVELHKPADNGFYCELCISSAFEYPCLTIQTIEEELK